MDLFIRRNWWAADLSREGAAILLAPRRGCRRIVLWRADLAEVVNRVDARAMLDAAPGDRFIACGASLDEIAFVVVTALDGDRLRVEITSGVIAETTAVVQLTEVARPKRARGAA